MSASEKSWTALILRPPAPLADALAAELAVLGLGVETRDEELVAYLTDPSKADDLRRWIEQRIEREGLDPSSVPSRVETVADGRWVERYQAGLDPFPLGERFTVYPRGTIEGDPGERQPLLLVPGRAFGTGEHATTQLCVEQLERRVRDGDRWLDLGCGTGVLLLVARACGAAHGFGIEIDPDAVEVAQEVVASNGDVDEIEIVCGGIDEAKEGCWDGAICNISATFTRMHLDDLS